MVLAKWEFSPADEAGHPAGNRDMRIGLAVVFLLLACLPASAQSKRPIDFNRDVRPILSDACFQCHGPDKAKRKADLRFDTEAGAFADLGGYAAIVPGHPAKSALVERITAKEPSKRMPPPKSGHGLKPGEAELLTRWIAEGAKYEKHWSLLPPVRATLPKTAKEGWARNAIDHFVLARLEKEGLTPSPEASRTTLIRRVSLDLTGLPPTPADVDAFLADDSPGAYEKVVDRLLASTRYGERMAHRWLDAARYADTNGYQTDGERVMWRWRDWVIEAFNKNMPFDRFTIEQIAGDLLPGATLQQKIATGFNRNHRGNSEGGVIPEEYAVEYVVDRVDTTATVWLGLTAGCAKCHSHKYDPLTQKEFYQLFAYFNNVPEKGKAIKYGNSPPYIKSPTREQEIQRAWLQARVKTARRTWDDMQPEVDTLQRRFEKDLAEKPSLDWQFDRGLAHHFPTTKGAKFLEDKDAGDFGFFDRFTISAWIEPTNTKAGVIVSRMSDADRADGYSFTLEDGKLHVNLVKRWLDDAIRVETRETLKAGEKVHVAFSYDGSRVAEGIKIFINGKQAKLKVNLDDLNQSFAVKAPFRVGKGGTTGFSGVIDDVRIFDTVVSAQDVRVLASRDSLRSILDRAEAERTPLQDYTLRSYFLDRQAPEYVKEAEIRLRRFSADFADFEDSLPTTMVMREMPKPRDTHILVRGEYDKLGTKVGPAMPAALPGLPPGLPNNRLGFAYSLVDRANPLTARVTVNRFWQMLFGLGIVKSAEDFGAQGDWPSHHDLLDWLAVEFMEPANDAGRWDVKHLLRTIVTSATYRQSSRVSADLAARDPDNRLLARGPRVRLPAEMIRDQALFAAGLLTERIGGPSIKTYQPDGLIKELHGTDDYVQDHGADLYRRSLYVHWKRTVPPPGLTTFDAAGREACVVRETRTNTPLQALYLLNDVTNMEAARVLAQRVLHEEGATTEDRLALAFRLATCRLPSPSEAEILRRSLLRHREHYLAHPDAARKLIAVGEYPLASGMDPVELAAYTATANTILNLDEVITKE